MKLPARPSGRRLWAVAILLATACVVAVVLLLDDVRSPQPLTFRMDLSSRGTPLKTATVYFVHPDSAVLVPAAREIVAGENESRTAEDLVAHLTRSSSEGLAPLPEGTRLLHFFRDGSGGAVLDFNEKVTQVRASGIREERLLLTALARTITDNLGVERVRVLVHGRPLERWGAHVDLGGTGGGLVP